MGYFQAKSDLAFIRSFKETAVAFLLIENELHELQEQKPWDSSFRNKDSAQEVQELYLDRRQKYVKAIDRASRLAETFGLGSMVRLTPPPAIGGLIHHVDIYHAPLDQLPWGQKLSPQMIIDKIDQTEQACEEQLKKERRKLYNPFYWLLEALTFILRIPFLIVKTSGFNVEKVEDQLLGRIFKLLEILALIGFLIRLGVSKPEIRSAVFKYLHIE